MRLNSKRLETFLIFKDMEDLLIHIVTISNNFPHIVKAAQEAADFLNIQQGLLRDPPNELREKCLFALQLCLETKKRKFTAIAIAGLQKMLKDDRFHSLNEPNDDSKWLIFQLLRTISCFFNLSDDVQVELLKVFLNIACSIKWSMNGRTLISTLNLCCEAYVSNNAAVQSAAQATASQTLRAFCFILEEDQVDNDIDGTKFNEIIPIMQFICSKIEKTDYSSQDENVMVFYLDCLFTLCSSLPSHISSNTYLKTFLWQKLCPLLISILGTPKIDKNIVTRNSAVEKQHGRGSGGLATAPSHNSSHVKTIYCINAELIRIFGTVSSLRPVLESLFHRMLLYPAPEHRLDALKSVEELLQNAGRLIDLSGPLIQEQGCPVSDLSLLRLIMDSIEESSNSSFLIMKACIMCCLSLIKAVEQICLGQCIPSNVAEIILKMYPTLLDSDYKGPCTYQSSTRLPSHYRERIKNESKLLKLTEQKNQENKDFYTDSSGDTEGPEEEDIMSENYELNEANYCNIHLNTQNFKLNDTYKYMDNDDREGARHFFRALNKFLPLLIPMRSSIQVDQSLQNFASQYCEGLIYDEQKAERSKMKADGYYIASYFTLLTDMHLVQSQSYSSKKDITITEEKFLIKARGVGILSYLSSAWLRELYQLIVSSSLLQLHGYLPFDSQPHALINLLTDIEGLDSNQKQSHLLWECRRLIKSSAFCEDIVEKSAGLRLCRRILTCCWETLIKVLAIPLMEMRFQCRQNNLTDFKFLKKNEKSKEMKHLVTSSINGLQVLTRLCNNIEMQDRCGSIIKLLASSSCSNFKEKTNLMRFQMMKPDSIRLTLSHSLTLELLLGSGIEIGSNCPDCWSHVIRCCIYVKKLEHKYFSKSENRNLGLGPNVMKKNEVHNVGKNSNLSFDPQLDEDNCADVYSFLCSIESVQNVSQLVSNSNVGLTEILKPSETAKVICVLSQLVDKVFEDAAMKMNLKSLKSFSSVLSLCSRLQLFPSNSLNNDSKRFLWFKLGKNVDTEENILLLDFTGEIMLRSIRSGRPLFHIMQIWEIIIPHLMEAACHKDLTIARKAIQHIHDSINAALTEHPELQNFYITEMWFKPFEKLLFLELCEPDIQDQIVSCICEFVEANFRDIRTGWRPLFAALKASVTNINSVLEVFRVFMGIDSIAIFSYAAVDYIMCLIRHLKLQSRSDGNSDFGFEILKYLKKCQSILNSTYKMSQSIKYNSACHIQVSDGVLVDPVIKDFDMLTWESSDTIPEDLNINLESSNSLDYFSQFECAPSLDAIDRPGGVLHVWFLLLEGMHSAVIVANSALQSSLLKVLYEDLESLIEEPGPVFGLIILNRLALPMAQSWLRQLSEIQEKDVLGFKQYIGLISDLVLKYFDRLQNDQTCDNLLNLLLSQTLLLLCECSIHQVPEVSKIGPPCIRHIILNMGKTFNGVQWTIATIALHRLCDLSLKFLRQLMAPFSKDSEYYYGDTSQVKVAVCKADSPHQALYWNQLSHRVFFMDEPYENLISTINNDNQKIYTFLISKPKGETIRISITSLVSTLQAHHYVLQIIADILIDNTIKKMSSLNFILNKNIGCRLKSETEKENSSLKSLMSSITPSTLSRLLSCLDHSYQCALAFNSRPGLKILIQKVAGLQRAANLYHQIGVAWAIKSITLFEYIMLQIRRLRLSTEDVKHRLDASFTNGDTELPSFSFFLNKFRKSFNELCTSYLKVVNINHNETLSASPQFKKSSFYLMSAPESNALKDEDDAKEDENIFKHSQSPNLKAEKNFWFSDYLMQTDSTGYNAETLSESDEKKAMVDKRNQYEVLKSLFRTNVESGPKNKNEKYSEHEKVNVNDMKEPSVIPEIEQQKRSRFFEDGESHRRVLSHMLASVFELLQRLEDDDFPKVLPIFIDGVERLTVRVSEPVLKQHISEFFQRIATLYGFGIV